uniref:Adhesin n=1 Tax=Serratia phage Kevin TaxID=3161161 RepID=A0AAU8KX05_9CAUD
MKHLKTVIAVLALSSAYAMGAPAPTNNQDVSIGDVCVFAHYTISRGSDLAQINTYDGNNRRGKVLITSDNRLRIDMKGEPKVVTGPQMRPTDPAMKNWEGKVESTGAKWAVGFNSGTGMVQVDGHGYTFICA